MGLSKLNVEKLRVQRDVEGLRKALRNKGRFVCTEVANALAEIGDARAVKPLIKLLRAQQFRHKSYPHYDNSGYISSDVAEALGEIGDPRAVEALIEAPYARYEVARNYSRNFPKNCKNQCPLLKNLGTPCLES